LNE
jgi:hypothetical protein